MQRTGIELIVDRSFFEFSPGPGWQASLPPALRRRFVFKKSRFGRRELRRRLQFVGGNESLCDLFCFDRLPSLGGVRFRCPLRDFQSPFLLRPPSSTQSESRRIADFMDAMSSYGHSASVGPRGLLGELWISIDPDEIGARPWPVLNCLAASAAAAAWPSLKQP